MPEPATETSLNQVVARWEKLRPANDDVWYLTGDSDERAALVNGLRELADLIEARPDIPAPDTSEAGNIYVNGTIAEKRAQVDYTASLLGTPVTDNTARGGHYYVTRKFGPVSYRMIATGVGAPRFAIGDEVHLVKEAAGVAKDAGLAQAGYVIGVTGEREGEYSYSVHFPGRAGTQSGWSSMLLRAARFSPVRLSTGEVTSIQDAENLLIELSARTELAVSRRAVIKPQELDDEIKLLKGLAAACGMEPVDLSDQLARQIEERIRGHMDAPGPKTAPELAASDRQQAASSAGSVPLPREAQPDGRQSAAGPKPNARPLQRKGR